MRFLRDALITVIVLVVVIAIIGYSRIRGGGFAADAQPGALERSIATRLVRLSIPADADRQQNPLAADANAWRSAFEHYQDHCATCHGRDGRGKTDMGQNMYPKVPDLTEPRVQNLSDGAVFYIIQNGVRWTGMPAWKGEHSPEETWRLVSLLRKMPSLTPQEIESLNPPAEPEAKNPAHHEHPHEHPSSPRTPR
ncbi:MAG TPA: cytochrome c [Vicinamibacterales bacterium]|jgi:mono/diheme cytochrome c family protein|nr:cytochrome c [Vicinamibacterales bacterium]